MNYKLIMFVFFGIICLSSLEAQSENLQKTIRVKQPPIAKSLSIKKPQPLPPGSDFRPKSSWPNIQEQNNPAIVESPSDTMPKPSPPEPNFEPTLPWPTSVGTFSITSNFFVENTAQVIPPHTNSACPTGRVVVSTGTPAKIFYRNLYNESGWYDENAITKSASLPIGSNQSLYDRTDNILIKLNDGSLMAIRLALTWEPVTNKPDWWDEVTDIGNGAADVFPKGTRSGLIVWHSVDGGTTWTRVGVIDPINYENQRYAWPQTRKNEEGIIWRHWTGGFDRMEAYADPWTGHIYVTANAIGGPIVDYSENKEIEATASTNLLFRSTDAGKTWEQIFKFDAGTPIVMTSTPNGRIYLYSVKGSQPILFYSLLGSEPLQFSKPKNINYTVDQDGNQTDIGAGIDAIYSELVRHFTNSISRISTDASSSKVRLSYSWVDGNGRSAIAVVKVEVPNNTAEPKVSPIATFHSANAANSILASSFIDPDATGATVAQTNTSIFYWVEGSTDPAQEAYVRYSVLRGDTSLSQPAVLAGPYKPTKFVGDYMYGGSFFTNDGSYNYLAQWVQEDGIRANIVTIPPYSPGVKLSRGGGAFSNVNFPGSDIEHIVMDSPPSGMLDIRAENCAAACGNRNDCVAWTYVRPNTIQGSKGNCWLKDNVPTPVKNTSCISGYFDTQVIK